MQLKDGYKLMGFSYEATGLLYSFGRIPRCKVAMLDHVNKGDRILIAGVGHGTEAIAAARKGADVTAVDISETMLKHMRKKIDRADLKHPISLKNNDILNITDETGFDMVFANFFLNVFSEEKMMTILTHLTSLVKPGGYMVIGDFAHPKNGGLFYKTFQNLYWYIAATLYWLTADNAVHPIYDYPALLSKLGFDITETRFFTILGMKNYWSVIGKKPLNR